MSAYGYTHFITHTHTHARTHTHTHTHIHTHTHTHIHIHTHTHTHKPTHPHTHTHTNTDTHTHRISPTGKGTLGQGRNWAVHAWLQSDLPQALKGGHLSVLGSQHGGTLISASAVPPCKWWVTTYWASGVELAKLWKTGINLSDRLTI